MNCNHQWKPLKVYPKQKQRGVTARRYCADPDCRLTQERCKGIFVYGIPVLWWWSKARQTATRKAKAEVCPECDSPAVNSVCQSAACKGRLL
jgi:hypothetical protein